MTHYQVLDKLLREHFGNKEVVGIEIGTGTGIATRTIIDALPNCKLYGIDPYEHRDGAEFEAGNPQEAHDRTKEEAQKRLQHYIDAGKLVWLPMRSSLAIELVPKEVDFVWIDGDHSAEGITTDLNLYEPLVKVGGILGGHDFLQVHPLTEIIMKRFDDDLNSGNNYTWWIFK